MTTPSISPKNFKILQDNIIIFIGLAGLFSLLVFLPPTQVGDGGQYYAMYFAWKNTFKPFMTESSWIEVGHLADSGNIHNFVSLEWLQNIFPALKLGSTADFSHFWFYSLLAALVNKSLSIIGIKTSPHSAFLIVHWMLLYLPFILAKRYFGWKGVFGVFVLTMLSPILWYIDKVHTEFFTYCLTLSAVIVFLKQRYITSALFLAITSTQNISFGLIAILTLLLDSIARSDKKYSFNEVIQLILTTIFVILHPIYYYFRYGVISSVFLTGDAKIGADSKEFYIWLFDPDIGLLPNWPLSIFLLLFGFLALKNNQKNADWTWWFFLTGYLTVSLLAQSSTVNINSGATPGIARYALWYIALFFPLMLNILDLRPKNLIITSFLILIGFCVILYSVQFYDPRLPEGHGQPSPISYAIQKYVPDLYNPPAEIFYERYSGIGESPEISKVLAVIGPDCRKVLLFHKPANELILDNYNCHLDKMKLLDILKEKIVLQSKDMQYIKLSQLEIEKAQFHPKNNAWYEFNRSGEAKAWLKSGWSQAEDWGTWSDSHRAMLDLPCPDSAYYNGQEYFTIELQMTSLAVPKHPITNISITANGRFLQSENITGNPQNVLINIPTHTCRSESFRLELTINNPISPNELGLSKDTRELGVGLIKIRYSAATVEPATVTASIPLAPLDEPVFFGTAGRGKDYLGTGWSTPEEWGVWSDGPKATLSMRLDSSIQSAVRLELEVGAFVAPTQPSQTVECWVNGQRLATLTFDARNSDTSNPSRHSMLIPKKVIGASRDKVLKLELRVAHPVSPKSAGLSEDSRLLGVALVRIKVSKEDKQVSYPSAGALSFPQALLFFLPFLRDVTD